MVNANKFKKSEQGFLAVYATLVMLMLFFIVAAWGPMMSQMATGNVETEKYVGAEYLAEGELSRVIGYIKNNTMTGDSAILDKVSAKDNLKYYSLKTNDDDSKADIDGFEFAIYSEPALNSSSSEFVVTAIAKYNGTTKIVRQTVQKGEGTSNEDTGTTASKGSRKLKQTQQAIVNIFKDAIKKAKQNGETFQGFTGPELNEAIVNSNGTGNGNKKTLYEETDDDFINELLGTTDYKSELYINNKTTVDKLYWHVNLGSHTEEDTVLYYLADSSTGTNGWTAWAIAIPTGKNKFIYYRGLNTNWNGTKRYPTGGLATLNNNTLESYQTILDASLLWEEVQM